MTMMIMASFLQIQLLPLPLLLLSLITASSWLVVAFTSTTTTNNSNYPSLRQQRQRQTYKNGVGAPLYAGLRKDVEIPLLDLIDQISKESDKGNDSENTFVIPLPSSDFPDQLATPFLYGMQMETPLHKMILEEAISMAETVTTATSTSASTPFNSMAKPMYGHLVWKDGESDSLVGAIGCTAEILVNAPTNELLGLAYGKTPLEEEMDKLQKSFSASEGGEEDNNNSNKNDNNNGNDDNITPTSNTLLCRGGWRFVVKEVVRSIPFPVVIVDEIQDDADEDDSDMFSTVGTSSEDEDDDEDDDDEDEFSNMPTPELIGNTMQNVQSIIGQQLDDAIAKTQLGPLEKSILEDIGGGEGEGDANNNNNNANINPAVIELAHAEEMSAVWDVFQSSLIDDIEPSLRRFSVAIMAAELANVKNSRRQEILLTRNSEERLRIVLRELKEIVGMTRARKMASTITDEADEIDKDLKVGKPTLPKWALQIKKGTKIEYFWNEEYGWCPGEVSEVQGPSMAPIVGNGVEDDEDEDEGESLLLTVRFDDGEEHRLPLTAEDKLRWRPGK